MPVPALPQPRQVHPDMVVCRRVYRDTLHRPLTGTVTITALQRMTVGDTVIPASPASKDLVNGVLQVELPPGRYRFTGRLLTVDGAKVNDDEIVTVAGPS